MTDTAFFDKICSAKGQAYISGMIAETKGFFMNFPSFHYTAGFHFSRRFII